VAEDGGGAAAAHASGSGSGAAAEPAAAAGSGAAAAAPQQEQQQEQHGSGARPAFDDAHTVFVKGMGHELEEDDLRALFADVAGLKEVRLARDHATNVPRVSPFGGCCRRGWGSGFWGWRRGRECKHRAGCDSADTRPQAASHLHLRPIPHNTQPRVNRGRKPCVLSYVKSPTALLAPGLRLR
jgi:hypothetical protein